MAARAVLAGLSLVAVAFLGTTVHDTLAPPLGEEPADASSITLSAALATPTTATLPTLTPLREIEMPSDGLLPRVAEFAASVTVLNQRRTPASLPTVTPSPYPTGVSNPPVTPTPLLEPDRSGCDPAYPDKRTCIPPGPPFAQGCAITDEREFTVIDPDPQALDHDGDGIGCEPVGGD